MKIAQISDMSKFDAHIYGPFFSASGVGESTRAYWRTLRATGLNIGILPQNPPFNEFEKQIYEVFKEYLVENPHPKLNFFRINAQEIENTKEFYQAKKMKETKNILIPMWETPSVPVNWRSQIGQFHGIFAATSFIRDAFAALETGLPIWIAPHEIHVDLRNLHTVQQLGLKDDRRYHFYAFSYASFVSRKNPLGLLQLQKVN